MNKTDLFTNKTLQPLTREDALGVLCTAIEGGIGCWACLCNDTPEWEAARAELEAETGEAPYLDDTMLRLMDKGQSVIFEDAECCEGYDDDEIECWKLTFDKFVSGCIQYERTFGQGVKYLLNEGKFDAEAADCVMQYALFGELVYG